MDRKPSVRNVISSAQEYLTFVENCPPFANAPGVSANADQIRQQITRYNEEIRSGQWTQPDQLTFEDKHAKAIVQSLKVARDLTFKATQDSRLKDYVVDGGGSEWNRQNPLKLTNLLGDVVVAEMKGTGRSPSAYHNGGPMEYEAHGGHGVLRIRNANQTLSPVTLPQAAAPAMKPKI